VNLEPHQAAALEAIGITEDQFHEAHRLEDEQRAQPGTPLVVGQLKRSGNPKVRKLADQYEKGLLTWVELEMKVREVTNKEANHG
jgi:hypothetical protein